jgi:hypothetical protein
LKYLDASFYQVARGLVLPSTVGVSFFVLQSRPSLRILLCCATVIFGFFIGVFLDGVPLSPVGVSFGVVSSAVTAIHSVNLPPLPLPLPTTNESLRLVGSSSSYHHLTEGSSTLKNGENLVLPLSSFPSAALLLAIWMTHAYVRTLLMLSRQVCNGFSFSHSACS